MSTMLPLVLQVRPFKGKVTVTENCWLFQGAKTRDGHGMVAYNTYNERYAHRLIYKQVYGQIPEGQYILHRCNTPSCVNPEHLYAGTQLDNMRDRAVAERNFGTKLTAQVVLVIRDSKERSSVLARCYDISVAQVDRIKRRAQWKHLK